MEANRDPAGEGRSAQEVVQKGDKEGIGKGSGGGGQNIVGLEGAEIEQGGGQETSGGDGQNLEGGPEAVGGCDEPDEDGQNFVEPGGIQANLGGEVIQRGKAPGGDGLEIVCDQVVGKQGGVEEALHPKDVLADIVLDDVFGPKGFLHLHDAEHGGDREAQPQPK